MKTKTPFCRIGNRQFASLPHGSRSKRNGVEMVEALQIIRGGGVRCRFVVDLSQSGGGEPFEVDLESLFPLTRKQKKHLNENLPACDTDERVRRVLRLIEELEHKDVEVNESELAV